MRYTTCKLDGRFKFNVIGPSNEKFYNLSAILSRMLGFEVTKSCMIIGESIDDFIKRKPTTTDIPNPSVTVKDNSAFINTAPLILRGLSIVSGKPDSNTSFSCLTVEDLLCIESCTVLANQGSCIVANGVKANCIITKCIMTPVYYCCYSENSILNWKSCKDNEFNMNEIEAIGSGFDRLDDTKAHSKKCIENLVKNGSKFDKDKSWPEY